MSALCATSQKRHPESAGETTVAEAIEKLRSARERLAHPNGTLTGNWIPGREPEDAE